MAAGVGRGGGGRKDDGLDAKGVGSKLVGFKAPMYDREPYKSEPMWVGRTAGIVETLSSRQHVMKDVCGASRRVSSHP